MNESLFDETLDIILKKALCEESLLLEKELEEAQVLAAQQPVKFSPEHEGKMKQLISCPIKRSNILLLGFFKAISLT